MNDRVLVIEDEPDVRRVLHAVLRRADYRVDEAADGRSALAFLADCTPDVIVADMGLPDIDGCSLLRALRRVTGVPILVLTAGSLDRDRGRALSCGADAFMQKPFENAALVATLDALVASSRRAVSRT